jgi:hypothetical protein
MRREPVSSSSIASIGYSADTKTLEVEFVTGRVYRYRGVEEETYEAFMSASSKGTFFNERIKDGYPFERVR